MFEINNLKNNKVYLAEDFVAQIVERNYDGGGCIVVLRDGTRHETYTPASDVRKLVES